MLRISKILKKSLSVLLVFTMILPLFTFNVLAEEKTIEISNKYIKAIVNKNNGRFVIETTDGQPLRKNDDNSKLTFEGDDTSFATFRIDGTDYIFGNPYDLDGVEVKSTLGQTTTNVDKENNKTMSTPWTLSLPDGGSVTITQLITLYNDDDKSNAGMSNVQYFVENNGGTNVDVSTRILLDTMIGTNDGPSYQNGIIQENLQTTERELRRVLNNGDVVDGVTIDDSNYNYYHLQSYYMMRDRGDYLNPLKTNIYAYGFLNMAADIEDPNLVDKVIVGHWNHLANSKFDVKIDPSLDFTKDTNDYGTADSAVAYYWDNKTIAPTKRKVYQVLYGVGEIVNENKDLNVTFIDQITQLQTNDEQTKYLGDGVFEINVQVQNPDTSGKSHSSVICELQLEDGLSFAETKNNKVVYENGSVKKMVDRSLKRTYTKTVTDIESGEPSLFGPGDMCTFTFTVVATGKAWPTTKEYRVEVTTPELMDKAEEAARNSQQAVDGNLDENLMDSYRIIRGDFILLPAIGELHQSKSYALTPDAAYYTDEKIVTIGFNNFGAYTKNDEGANFRAFFKNIITGDRYEINIDRDVTLIDKDGANGVMRINYRGGMQVDEVGNRIDVEGNPKSLADATDPTLPVGEYAVSVAFQKSAGIDDEQIELLSFTTDKTISVSTDAASRIRTAGYFVLARRYVSLTNAQYDKYKGYIDKFNNAVKVRDANAMTYSYQKGSRNLFPYYEYKLLNDESEIDAYRKEINEYTDSKNKPKWDSSTEWDKGEILVIIKGMVKDQDGVISIDTGTEPAIINNTVKFSGSDISIEVSTWGSAFLNASANIINGLGLITPLQKQVFGEGVIIPGDEFTKGLGMDVTTISGSGKLAIAAEGFEFYDGRWSLDFYNGFAKSLFLQNEYVEEPNVQENEDVDMYDVDAVTPHNPVMYYENGYPYEKDNPLWIMAEPTVYFNQKSLSTVRKLSTRRLSLTLDQFALSSYDGLMMASLAGDANMRRFTSTINNIEFDSRGYRGIESYSGFDIWNNFGILKPVGNLLGGNTSRNKGSYFGKPVECGAAMYMRDYRDDAKNGRLNRYAMSFKMAAPYVGGVKCAIAFKETECGLVLPNDIIFAIKPFAPGVPLVLPNVFLRCLRGAIRNLADTLGSPSAGIPLTLAAGVTIEIGLGPIIPYLEGNVDAVLKTTGIKFSGDLSLGFLVYNLALIDYAKVEVSWCDPVFLSAEISANIGGWDIVVGKGYLFIGQNAETGEADFDAYISAEVTIPKFIPVVGGITLLKTYFGINKERICAGIPLFLIVKCITINVAYYYGKDVDIWVNNGGEPVDDSMCYLLYTDEESGNQQLVGYGSNMKILATSYKNDSEENSKQDLVFTALDANTQLIEYRSNVAGVGGIETEDFNKTHKIPVSTVFDSKKAADALIQIEYFGEKKPELSVQDKNGNTYAIKMGDLGDDSKKNDSSAPNTLYGYYNDREIDGTTQRYAYIFVPYEDLEKIGTLTLKSDQSIDSAMISVERGLEVNDVSMNQEGSKLTLNAKTKYAKEGAVANFYLTNDKYDVEEGEVGEVGVPIGSYTISKEEAENLSQNISVVVPNIESCEILGKSNVNLNEMLQSGKYYLSVIVTEDTMSKSKQTENYVTLTDPLAPNGVTDASMSPAGNGYFNVKFKMPDLATDKADGVRVDFFDENGEEYDNYTEIYMAKEDLTYDEATGFYTGKFGGLSETTNSFDTDGDGVMDSNKTVTVGLETGKIYSAEIRGAKITVEEKDGEEVDKYHFSVEEKIGQKLLPNIEYANAVIVNGTTDNDGASYTIVTNDDVPTLVVKTDKAAKIDIYNSDEIVSSAESNGKDAVTIKLDSLKDVESKLDLLVVTTNNETMDEKTHTVFITIDRVPPQLFIDAPVNGAMVENGIIKVSGVTDGGNTTKITVFVDDDENGTDMVIDGDGNFAGNVKIASDKSTAKLTLVAEDLAGNENRATVSVNNSDFEIIQNIVLKGFEGLSVGKEYKLETVARIADGKDKTGKVQYKEKLIDNNEITYSLYKGNSVSLLGGKAAVISQGSSIVKAEYTSKDGEKLEAMTVLTSNGTANTSGDDITGGNGTGDNGSGTGTGTGSGGGGGGGGGGAISADSSSQAKQIGVSNSKTKIDGNATAITVKGNIATIDAKSGKKVETTYACDGYTVNYEKGTEIEIDTPLFKSNIDEDTLINNGVISVVNNKKAKATNGELLGAIDISFGNSKNMTGTVKASIALPEDADISDVDSIILTDENGKITPVPFKLNMIGNKAYFDVLLKDEGTITFEKNDNTFSDVNKDSWSFNEITQAAKQGIVFGIGNNKFAPLENVTRGAFTTILLRTAGLLTQESTTELPDVNKGSWDYLPLAIGKDIGLIMGKENGNMCSNDKISRIEAMVMAGRIINKMDISQSLTEKEINSILKSFNDSESVPDWAKADAAMCIKYGIIQGTNGNIDPISDMSREQGAAIANRINDLFVSELLK